MISIDIQARVLELYPLLGDLQAEQLQQLLANATYMRVPGGALMFDENQPCMGFPMVISGSARVIKSSPSGRELHLYHVMPGETCILTSSCLLSNAPYQARGEAHEELELVVLPPGTFKLLFSQLEPFRNQVFNRFSERLTELMNLVTAVAFQKPDQRLAALLLSKINPVTMTHQAIADELGSFRELVSRLLKDFEHKHWVRLERGCVHVPELGYMARIEPEFTRRNAKLIGLSIDPVDNHARWVADIAETQGGSVNYPMIGDTDLAVAKLYNMLPAQEPGTSDGRTAATNATVRSVFIIGPDKRIKLMLTYPMTTGRNFDEILRVLDSMQLTASYKVATPVNWQPGEDVIITPAVGDEEAAQSFPGFKTIKPYLRTTAQPV